jgi:hypothetical protein
MKRLLSPIVLLFCSFAIRAQDNTGTFKSHTKNTGTNDLQIKLRPSSFNDTLKLLTPSLFSKQHPKPGIYRLRQDNMPCIVPNLADVASIPNGWKGKTKVPYSDNPPLMPNPSRPLLILPPKSKGSPDGTK